MAGPGALQERNEELARLEATAAEPHLGAQGADAQVRLLCIVDGDVADVMNMTIVSTKTTNAPVTTE